jgi:predicted metal-binding membrane protein
VFFGTVALLFTAAAVVTILSGAAMETMGAVPMAGGWLLSGIWLPLCGQSWLETAACFLGMWLVMMVTMMLPSLAPALWRYREAVCAAGANRPGGLATLAGASYFAVWTGFGLLTFLLGASLAQAALQFPSLGRLGPIAGALAILIAGLAQASRWKARLLADCHGAPHAAQTHPGAMAALGAGAILGLRCCLSCLGPMTMLTAGGLMDLRLMAGVTIAITAERLLPAETRIADAIGVVMAAAGLLLFVQMLG